MADPAYGWQKERSLRDWLFDEPFRFEFYQAVRLLEALRQTGTGENCQPEQDAVRFRSRVSFDFPASEIQSLDDTGSVPGLTVNFFGLAGALGPLPAVYSEMILAAGARKDHAPADFLDIFNHRLLMLLYRARQAHRPPLTALSPEKGSIARFLFSAMGLGLPQLREGLGVPDRSLLYYSGLFARKPGTAVGLERLLADYFHVPVRIQQFIGRWRVLDPAQRTMIGMTGQNQALGGDAVLGTRVWDQGAAIEIYIGPLGFDQFQTFLSGRSGHDELAVLTRLYLGNEQDAEACLLLKAEAVPVSVIGKSRLGYTSWLRRHAFHGTDQPVRVSLSA
jgi:type VI secretion system protein ImpH